MAIREFSPEGSPRAKIAFVGAVPDPLSLKSFNDRGFRPVNCKVTDLAKPKLIDQLDAVIWSQDPHRINELPRLLPAIVPGLLNYDVRTYIRVAANPSLGDAPRRLIINTLISNGIPSTNLFPAEWNLIPAEGRDRRNNFLSPSAYLIDSGEPWSSIANTVGERLAIWPINKTLEIDEAAVRARFPLGDHDERMLLLRRSFWNCSQIEIAPVPGGLSGAPVVKVYATLAAGLIPQGSGSAYLYFAKIGPRKKIVDEYDKYTGQILEYVPFHLGPRLRRDRCNLGSTQGILVGDFVDGAEPLLDCARGGRCGHAISGLFDKTLGSWRKQMFRDPKYLLADQLQKKWYAEGTNAVVTLPTSRKPIVRKLKGRVSTSRLKAIFDRLASTVAFIAPAHGDMHAGNVLVRHGDAIIIDFEKMESNFPATYDPASLEGGLLTDGFVESLNATPINVFRLARLLMPLYERTALAGPNMTICRSGDPTEWYYGAVNQIRGMGWASEAQSSQYALTLALCLLKKGCNTHPSMTPQQNDARALAFFFGQKILFDLDKAMPSAKAKKVRKPKKGPNTIIRRKADRTVRRK